MNLEYFIAKRTATSSKGDKPNVMMRVATLSVALGITVMIIALAVVYGFKREISSKLTGFTSHLVVGDVIGANHADGDPIVRDEAVESLIKSKRGFRHLNPYSAKSGIIRGEQSVEGVMLKGVDSLYNWDFFSSALVEGDLPRVGGDVRSKDILISQDIASRLMVKVDDRLEMIFTSESGTLRRDLFKISGIYSTGLAEWDRLVLVTDMRNVQRLNEWSDNEITGYEVRFKDISYAESASEKLNEELLYSDIENVSRISAYSAQELFPSIFDWLKAHDVNALVIIVIMIIVAGFNMTTALLIMVLERTRMIGTLKALGMDNRSLQKIFLYRSLRVILYGLGWGNLVGIGLCALQVNFNILKLDASGYMISVVPIDLSAGWIVMLNIGVIATILMLMIIPTRLVAYIRPETTIKFN